MRGQGRAKDGPPLGDRRGLMLPESVPFKDWNVHSSLFWRCGITGVQCHAISAKANNDLLQTGPKLKL